MRSTLRTLALAAATCAATATLPAVTHADAPAPTTRAADLYRRATRLYADHKLAEAEPLYLEAWELQQSYEIASNLGALELELNKPRMAAELLSRALREFPVRGHAEERAALEARLAEAKKRIGTLKVTVSLPGGEKGAAAGPPPDVLVDGRFVGRAPLQDAIFVEPGARVVEASSPGRGEVRLPVDVVKGVTYRVNLQLAPPRKRSLVPAFVGGAVGVAALGAGAVLVGLAQKQINDANALHASIQGAGQTCAGTAPGCAALHSATAGADTLGNAGVGMFVVAGAAAAGTLTYLLWPARAPGAGRPVDVRASLGAGPSGGMLRILGSF